MKIIQSLPRVMRFQTEGASSVELCVADWISGSRYRHETTVFAERGGTPLIDVEVFRLAPAKRLTSWHLAYTIRRQIALRGYELVVGQQHVPTVARIAAFNRGTPVILQTHNFIDSPRPGKPLANKLRSFELSRLAGITLVSEATLRRFESDWPQVQVPRRVVSNGFDFSTWHPAAVRQKTVIVVGRVHETKGILEAAQGACAFLQKFPDWRAAFILAHPQLSPDYFKAVADTLATRSDQTELLVGVPFSVVKRYSENAAISVVASKWDEPFGRTALEAHAGGAALVSSQTGGLREISGEAAITLPEISGAAIAAALTRLAQDDALRDRLAREGMERARRLFWIGASPGDVPGICERLDDFYDEVFEGFRRAKSRRDAVEPAARGLE
jgi:glycosyltransferase involved in cell wall biosynthesis